RVPGVTLAGRYLNAGPVVIAGEYARVALAEHLRIDGACQQLLNFAIARPDLRQHDRLAGAVGAQGLLREIDVEGARQRVRDDQWWGGKEIHAHFRMHAALE